jgi:hypothetical protein
MREGNAKTGSVTITVLSVTPVRAGRILALASVEIDVDGVVIDIHGIRAARSPTGATTLRG